jgi:hypothetical protein
METQQEQDKKFLDELDALREKNKHRFDGNLYDYFDVNITKKRIDWKTNKRLPTDIEISIDVLIKKFY